MISDFFDTGFSDALKIANKKHDIVALRVYDLREKELPNVGLIKLQDTETGELKWVDTSDKQTRVDYMIQAKQHDDYLKDTFNKSGVDTISLNTSESYITPLMNLFKKRERR